MLRIVFIISVIMGALAPTGSNAQTPTNKTGWDFQKQKHRLEFTVLGGNVWTSSRDVRLGEAQGELDIDKSAFIGVALDVNLAEKYQLELLYNRQESEFIFTSSDQSPVVVPMSVEYFHIGAIGGIQKGNVLPFTQFTLGATRFAVDGGSDPDWKFSMMLGMGVKFYLTKFLALRLQGRLPFTFVGSESQIGCGPHGCFTMLGGVGIAQYDIAIGLALLL